MIRVIMGKKGTGKTKQMIDMINEAVGSEHGNVVCIEKGNKLALDGIRETIENGGEAVLKNETKGESYKLCYSFSGRQKDIILAGGLLNYTRESHK